MREFLDLLRAEWTKFRTVRGWVVAMAAAAMAIVAFGLMPGVQGSCGMRGPGSECVLPTGPSGDLVTDTFTFVHQTLSGDGSIAVRTTGLSGQLPPDPTDPEAASPRPGVTPWAKAGLLAKVGTAPGSPYAAVMVTGGHGVRMQYDFLHDTAGSAAAVSAQSRVWLRLTRTGDTLVGEESSDGVTWQTVDVVRLTGLPEDIEVGMFVTSPQHVETMRGAFGIAGAAGGPTMATATFDRIDRQGSWADGDWIGELIGGADNGPVSGQPVRQDDGVFTVTGSGDIAPAVQGGAGLGTTVTQTLVGTFAALVLVVVVGALFITAEYRRGLIRITLAAHPRRARVLLAKVVVLAAVAFGCGLAAAAVVVPLGQRALRANGVYVAPASIGIELRLIAGTAALLAMAAVLALALGAILRHGVAAVTAAVLVIVMPYLLVLTVLPPAIAQPVLSISPAAAFAVQQSAQRYAQVDALYTPAEGYFPLSPTAGLAVLGVWTVLALGTAALTVGRRDQ